MSKIRALAQLGQSIWCDHIRRFFITAGELQAMIAEGVTGVTSNPSLFEKAIIGSADYDEEIKQLSMEGRSSEEIYDVLSMRDMTLAADLLSPIYEATDGRDGWVSLEVRPELAHDTSKTIAEAKRLYEALHHPNVMIKVPATSAGIPSIEELIAAGVPVNVTLIFSIENYKEVAEAYIKGLEKLAETGPSVKGGHPINRIESVASFFISRVDTAIDAVLEKIGHQELQGKIAIANAKLAYATFQKILRKERWARLVQAGARIQRLLWGSTGTKNPHYPDTLYVDELIGPDTINTVPPATYYHFKDHGTVAMTLTEGLQEAEDRMAQLADLKIDLDEIMKKLQEEGVASFSRSFRSTLSGLTEKCEHLLAQKRRYRAHLGNYQPIVETALAQLRDQRTIERIWSHDHTLWKDDPSEISNRLGWLHSPEMMIDFIPEIRSFVDDIREDGWTHALLVGMGGSSLAPEMFRHIFGVREGYLDLAILDSTDPGAVLDQAHRLDLARTLVIVSTKSGKTVETISFMKYFYNQLMNKVGKEKAGRHMMALTDPGSELESIASRLQFRKIFLNDPHIGGRFSALSFFGLVPAALIGMKIETLLDRAMTMVCNCEGCNCPVRGDHSAAWLGTILGEMAKAGRDKLTLILSPPISPFGSWVEQLLAESTGKEGKGILPITGEMLARPESYYPDRLFVYLRLENDRTYDDHVNDLERSGHPVVTLNLHDRYDIGGEIFRWEMATAIAGIFLGINPFDQPDVERSKAIARNMVTAYQKEGKLPQLIPTLKDHDIEVYGTPPIDDLKEAFHRFLASARCGKNKDSKRSYIAIQAYLPPSREIDGALHTLRTSLQVQYGIATTVGYGPRFLHSTGQLHKGDGGLGLFIQITADMPEDTPIPNEAGKPSSSITFGILKMAQWLGDWQALLEAGRKVIRFHLKGEIIDDLRRLSDIIDQAS